MEKALRDGLAARGHSLRKTAEGYIIYDPGGLPATGCFTLDNVRDWLTYEFGGVNDMDKIEQNLIEEHFAAEVNKLGYLFYDLPPVPWGLYTFKAGKPRLKGRTLYIPEDHTQDDVLRGMLTVYEAEALKSPEKCLQHIRRWYSRQQKKNLNYNDELIDLMMKDNGVHSLFFVLKSLDLDNQTGCVHGVTLGVFR